MPELHYKVLWLQLVTVALAIAVIVVAFNPMVPEVPIACMAAIGMRFLPPLLDIRIIQAAALPALMPVAAKPMRRTITGAAATASEPPTAAVTQATIAQLKLTQHSIIIIIIIIISRLS